MLQRNSQHVCSKFGRKQEVLIKGNATVDIKQSFEGQQDAADAKPVKLIMVYGNYLE